MIVIKAEDTSYVKDDGFGHILYYFFNSCNTKPIILFLSFGLLSATSNVKTVSASGVILSFLKIPDLFKNHTNAKAPLRLLPSTKGWFLTIKYRRWADFSSRLEYASFPKTV